LVLSTVVLTLPVGGCSNSVGARPASAGPPPQTLQGTPVASPAGPSPASYDQTCSEDADCVGVPVLGGPKDCTNCIMAAINKSAEAQYDAAVSAAGRPPVICPCGSAVAVCTDGHCQVQRMPRPPHPQRG
jgi:hypothetical protein